MVAKDLMRTRVVTVHEDDPVEAVLDLLIGQHFHGAPVIGADGTLVGVVSQQDVFFASMSRPVKDPGSPTRPQGLRARDIMTAPAVSATEETDVGSLCLMMHKLRIHRVPILRSGKLTGIISSLDICGAIGRGEDLTA